MKRLSHETAFLLESLEPSTGWFRRLRDLERLRTVRRIARSGETAAIVELIPHLFDESTEVALAVSEAIAQLISACPPSAHCCLGPFWSERLGKNELMAFQASTRGGTVRVRVAGDRVLLGGQAVTVLKGSWFAPHPQRSKRGLRGLRWFGG